MATARGWLDSKDVKPWPPSPDGGFDPNVRSEFAPPTELAVGSPIADRSLRLACIAEANATAKLGLSHDVFRTAERYYRFAVGQAVEDETAGLTFKQRLDALTREFLRDERSDQRKMLHELEEYVISYKAAFGDVADAQDALDEKIRSVIMEHG